MSVYDKFVRIFIRCIGSLWIIVGGYGIFSALNTHDNRATELIISLVMIVGGAWLVRRRQPSKESSGNS
jgi:hypothetical protein